MITQAQVDEELARYGLTEEQAVATYESRRPWCGASGGAAHQHVACSRIRRHPGPHIALGNGWTKLRRLRAGRQVLAVWDEPGFFDLVERGR